MTDIKTLSEAQRIISDLEKEVRSLRARLAAADPQPAMPVADVLVGYREASLCMNRIIDLVDPDDLFVKDEGILPVIERMVKRLDAYDRAAAKEVLPDLEWPTRGPYCESTGAKAQAPTVIDTPDELAELRAESEQCVQAIERWMPLTDSLPSAIHKLVDALKEHAHSKHADDMATIETPRPCANCGEQTCNGYLTRDGNYLCSLSCADAVWEVNAAAVKAQEPDIKAIKLARKQIESLIVTRILCPDVCDLIPRESVLAIFDRMVAHE